MINNKKVGLIAAVDITGKIGYDGKIPWKNPYDLKRFKELTMGNTLVMGRKTFEGLPKKLNGRIIHVLSNTNTISDDCDVLFFNKMTDAIRAAKTSLVWIAGGGEVYKDALNMIIPDFIDLSIISALHLAPAQDNLAVQKEKRVLFPEIPYHYKVVSETINEYDSKLYHRKYEIRPEWSFNI